MIAKAKVAPTEMENALTASTITSANATRALAELIARWMSTNAPAWTALGMVDAAISSTNTSVNVMMVGEVLIAKQTSMIALGRRAPTVARVPT